MLCDSCQHQNTCFLPQLAAYHSHNNCSGDRLATPKAYGRIPVLLDKLQVCELYLARFPQGLSWADGFNQLYKLVHIGWTGLAAGTRHLLRPLLKDGLQAERVET
ncbi:hypothetical protein [Trichothermofontia sp.]